jgi:hypothetical protein
MTIAHLITAIMSLLCVGLTPAVVGAQTRLFVTLQGQQQCNNCETEYALEIDVDNGRLVDQAVIRDANSTASVAATADGRYLIWIGKEGLGPISLSALDSVTNTMVLNAPGAGANFLNSVYAHPTRTRVFVADGATILALEPQGQQMFSPGGPGCPFARLTGVSRSGERLFVSCSIGLGLPGETRVLDSETGTLISSLADVPPLQVPNVDGTELFHIQTTPSVILTRRDAMTGAVLAQRDVSTIAQSAFAISIDPVTGRVFLVGNNVTPSGANHLTIFEPDDLALVTRFVAPNQNIYVQIARPVFSDEGRAYWATAVPLGGRLGTRFSVLDTVNPVQIATVDLATSGTPSGIAMALKPSAATNVTSSVVGRSVTIRWNAGGGPPPSTYVLEVGLAPGATNLTINMPSGATEYAVPVAPSGTYFVRVRAVNAGGALGRPSSEVQVVVP